MNLRRTVCTSLIGAGVGVAGMFGLGLTTANADPGQHCGTPNAPACQQQPAPQRNAPAGDDWQHHDINQARRDHAPFQYNGQHVQPMPAGNGDGWGFWFLGQWIRL